MVQSPFLKGLHSFRPLILSIGKILLMQLSLSCYPYQETDLKYIIFQIQDIRIHWMLMI